VADGALTARGHTALGSALVHSARGSGEEGATALHHALAVDAAEPATRAQALCEPGYVGFLHGRYDRVEVWLGQAGRCRRRQSHGLGRDARAWAPAQVEGASGVERDHYADVAVGVGALAEVAEGVEELRDPDHDAVLRPDLRLDGVEVGS